MENIDIGPTAASSKETDFKRALASVTNEYSWDNYTNTPDFILSDMLHWTLLNYHNAKRLNDKWHTRTKECKCCKEIHEGEGHHQHAHLEGCPLKS